MSEIGGMLPCGCPEERHADAIRARDRQVREAALAEAAEWLAAKVQEVREVTRDCRREVIALREAGKEWSDAFHRECLSDARCSGFRDAEEHIRALATGGPDGGCEEPRLPGKEQHHDK